MGRSQRSRIRLLGRVGGIENFLAPSGIGAMLIEC